MKYKLLFAIKRSQQAYQYYNQNKMYYQALRIYKANEEVYRLLKEFMYESDIKYEKELINYMFHIEDWSEQFNNTVIKQKPEHEDIFVFERLLNSIEYPKGICEIIES